MYINDLIKSKFENNEVAVLVKENPIIIHFVPCNGKGIPDKPSYHFIERQNNFNANPTRISVTEIKPVNTAKEIIIGKPIEKDGENILMWDGEIL